MALCWLWWHAWVPFDAVVAAAVWVAGVVLGDINLHFVWQAWHLWYWAASCVAFQWIFCVVGTCVRSCRTRCYSPYVEVILSVRSPRTRRLSTFSALYPCMVIHVLLARYVSARSRKLRFVMTCRNFFDHHQVWANRVWPGTSLHVVLSLKFPCLLPLAGCHGVRHVLCVATQRTHTYMHTYIHTYIHPYMQTRIHAYTHTCIHIHTYRHTSSSLTRKSFIRTFHQFVSLSCLSHSVFTFLFWLIGKSWHVGLSGPLIFLYLWLLYWMLLLLKLSW